MLEFVGVIAGAAACIVLIVLIVSLVSWVTQDAKGIFSVVVSGLGG